MKTLFMLIWFLLSAINLSAKDSVCGTVQTMPRRISEVANTVIAEGRWEALPSSYSDLLPKINAVYITCQKDQMTCSEMISILYTPEDKNAPKNGKSKYTLNYQVAVYKVVSWNEGVVKAVYETFARDKELIISVKDGTAERSDRETKAHGSETANPDIVGRWVLK